MADIRRIETDSQLDELFAESTQKPVWLFKHSLTCPISTAAWREYSRWVEARDDETTYALIEIQRARPLSKAVAERTGLKHESPQAILLDESGVSWHASHWKITEAALTGAIS